jgi:diamine N-acetyltransferase
MITIKTASFDEIETIRQLADKIWHEAYAEILSPEQISYMLNWMYSSETIRNEILEGTCWEAISEGNIPIGFISTTVEGSSLKLSKLYINPEYHSKGYGQESLNHTKEMARGKGPKSVYLTVNKGNLKAMKAYEKAGFTRTGSKVFDIGSGYVMDDFIYTYVLD